MPKIKGNSKYFMAKYGTPNPEFATEKEMDFQANFSPASFLYLGRALAEGLPLDGNTFYGHIEGLGEFVHKTELE